VGGPADLEGAIAVDGAPRTNYTWARLVDPEPAADLPWAEGGTGH
jgi:hypothetical protein